jgi:GNAT superfamily N-acetyltransferase
MEYLTVLLDKTFKKSEFSCGKQPLDDYLHQFAKQDAQKDISRTFVLPDGNKIKGYYSLSSSSIPREHVPEEFIKKHKLPRYTSLPTVLLGRLAVDKKYQGQKLGSLLLFDVFKRCYEANLAIAAFALVVDALDSEAFEFYKKFGFIPLDSQKLFLPMQSIVEYLQETLSVTDPTTTIM